ncbi:unnamed protein product [Bemisia tabaci]|uniref:Helicase ATP-binding domain-containing protein n=1 Tax=Bemisia tabaci TaxID=7038 RepID=A0A9P0EXC4_BEMTA|nr:unnamed protein product [Bemisia tabaci]
MVRQCLVIVVLPLVALLLDMFNKLKDVVACIDLRETDFCEIEQLSVSRILDGGRSVFFFVTAERLQNLNDFKNFIGGRFEDKCIVYDEAHCIPTWGVEFRPSLVAAHSWTEILPTCQVVLLSATIAELDIRFIEKAFRINIHRTITDLHIRPNIEYSYVDITSISEVQTIHSLLKQPLLLSNILNELFDDLKHVLVFFESRDGVKRLAEAIESNNIRSTWIESGTSDMDKETRLREWLAGTIEVLLGTSALSLGNVRWTSFGCVRHTAEIDDIQKTSDGHVTDH